MADANGGWFGDGRTVVPLQQGAASLVIHRDGSATVGQWGRDVNAGTDVAAVRQNLQLIVDGGRPVPGLTTNAGGAWGSAKNQLQYTWRSGVGVTANGGLVYAGGANMSLAALADALTNAGAVRGMQLDIHDKMVDLFTYGHAGDGRAERAPAAAGHARPGQPVSGTRPARLLRRDAALSTSRPPGRTQGRTIACSRSSTPPRCWPPSARQASSSSCSPRPACSSGSSCPATRCCSPRACSPPPPGRPCCRCPGC